MTDIDILLPSNCYQAIINANSPSALNPFATILDITGGSGDLYQVLTNGNSVGGLSITSADTNSILSLADTSATLSRDSTSLILDTSGIYLTDIITGKTRVGINTVNPAFSLDVTGTASLTVGDNSPVLNDLTASFNGNYSGYDTNVYIVEIDGLGSMGSSDTVSIKKNGLTLGALIQITGSSQGICDHVDYTFGSTTGHTIGDSWTITATPRGITNVTSAYFMGSEFFGAQNVGANWVVLGNNAVPGMSGNFVGSVVIGVNAASTSVDTTNAVIIGYGAGTGNITGSNIVVIGEGTSLHNDEGNLVAIGEGVIGYANSFISGSDNMNINHVYFGAGKISTSPTSTTIHGSGAQGTDLNGGNLILASGISTGNTDPAIVEVHTSIREATGTTSQSVNPIHQWNEFQSWSKQGQRINRIEISDNTTIDLSYYYIAMGINGGGANMRVTLPAASDSPAGTIFIIKDAKAKAASFVYDIKAAGSDKIDGSNIFTFTSNYESITIVSDGIANWEII